MQTPEIVPCPGSFNLHSRVVRLHTGSSYRDIAVHEMTESEIDSLKQRSLRWFVFGVMAGALPMYMVLIYALKAVGMSCGTSN